MKKFASAVLCAFLLTAAACAAPSGTGEEERGKETNISIWTYPIGEWGNANSVAPLINAFRRAHPEISITFKAVDYITGDKEVEDAIKAGEAPDLILEGPERIVVDYWGSDLMVPLDDLWGGEETENVYENVEKACKKNGTYYFYPICMTTHCMAINRTEFEAADAMRYIDEATHTWKSAEAFKEALAALSAYEKGQGGDGIVASVYCNGRGGDQGTRALVNNLFGGTFADGEKYTVDSVENIKALQMLYEMQSAGYLRIDETMNGGDEQAAFCRGELAMSFCWNVAAEVNNSISHPDFASSIFPTAFPADGTPSLQGGIWGFGIFDSGNKERISAAKEFIRFIGEEDYTRAVTTSSYLPVRTLERDPYENDALMNEYDTFSKYLGAYYQIAPKWSDARDAWASLLQKVGKGEDIESAIRNFASVTGT